MVPENLRAATWRARVFPKAGDAGDAGDAAAVRAMMLAGWRARAYELSRVSQIALANACSPPRDPRFLLKPEPDKSRFRPAAVSQAEASVALLFYR